MCLLALPGTCKLRGLESFPFSHEELEVVSSSPPLPFIRLCTELECTRQASRRGQVTEFWPKGCEWIQPVLLSDRVTGVSWGQPSHADEL